MGFRKRVAGPLIVAAVAIAGAGCGGGGSGSSGDSAGEAAAPSEPSAEFITSGPNGKLAKVGKEASVAEREAASRVLEKSFDAREEGDWATQCSTLASGLVRELLRAAAAASPFGGPGTCAQLLEAQAGTVPPAVRANNMTGPIDALRVNQGINGFAFYHGTGGKDYMIPLIKQGSWKLVALSSQELP